MTGSELAVICDDVAGKWLRVWEVGREATDKPNGPSSEEVDDALDKAFAWHDLAEKIRKEG